jgi:RNA polymerase sigma-70 factor (ECF subfamily)
VVDTGDAALKPLLSLARAGDAEAYGELCRSLESALLRQALRLCGDATLAEDLAQETLLEGWRCLRRYNGQCQLLTWLCAILLNRYRNTRRAKWPLLFSVLTTEREAETGLALSGPGDTRQIQPDQAAAQSEQAALVRRCVQALPRKHRQVIFLRFYVDDSLEGIAAAVGCSVGTVKSRLFHAFEKLRRMKELEGERPNLVCI